MFRFAFETLLKHRKRLEEVAQKNFMVAQASVDAALLDIKNMYIKTDEIRQEIAQIQIKGRATGKDFAPLEDYLSGLKIKIERKRMEARELMRVAEELHEILSEKAKEYKMIEKLKEKRLKQYKKEAKMKEQKEAEDIVTMRYKRRLGA